MASGEPDTIDLILGGLWDCVKLILSTAKEIIVMFLKTLPKAFKWF